MLKKQVSPKIVAIVFGVIVVVFAIAVYVSAQWTEPTEAPPGSNVPAPLNVSSIGQSKIGGLALNTGIDGIPSADGAVNGLLIYDGNVGIGTTSPAEKLDVAGNIVASGSICANGGSDCVGSGGGYCYTYYSTSLSSCDCPSGETNKKDLGLWGYCYYTYYSYTPNYVFRPPGLSCADVGSYNSVNRGLACVCCEG